MGSRRRVKCKEKLESTGQTSLPTTVSATVHNLALENQPNCLLSHGKQGLFVKEMTRSYIIYYKEYLLENELSSV